MLNRFNQIALMLWSLTLFIFVPRPSSIGKLSGDGTKGRMMLQHLQRNLVELFLSNAGNVHLTTKERTPVTNSYYS